MKHTLLINVETILTDYVSDSIHFWNEKAKLIKQPLPLDFLESWLSAGYDATEMVFFRFPRFKAFQDESTLLYTKANQTLKANRDILVQLKAFGLANNMTIVYAFDQNKRFDPTIKPFIEAIDKSAIVLFNDDAILGKPEANLYFKAAKLSKSKPSKTIVLAASKNGLLAAHVGFMRSVYLDQGLGVSERIFKYSNRQATTLDQALTYASFIANNKITSNQK